jgi:hypothetical protein
MANVKNYIVTESFGDFEIWRSYLMSKEEAYLHAAQLKNDNNRGQIKILEYLPIKNSMLN